MSTIKQIKQTLEESDSLKLVAQAYSEIAAVKLQKIRAGIERNRKFFEEVSFVYRAVKIASLKRNILPPPKKKGSISLLITSNYRFYGDLENRLTRFFILSTTKARTDRLIIGKTGADFLQAMQYFHPYQQIVFKEDLPNQIEIKNLSQILSNYKQIIVYYSRFKSVMIQEPQVIDVTATASQTQAQSKLPQFDYIFEPEINKILEFFDSQITILLLQQAFLDSELARTAARLIAMEQAQQNADQFIKEQKKLLAATQRSVDNLRILETIASLFSLERGKHAR